ncbi:hypothetical protein [Halomicrobium mukohataei]|uniref:hypothetical protein n=1 Tax=Halomicrobium mukohataei TaxID=57705 RepID=UPI00198182DB|nr:hypothetical protein [Halomicrobium mukohataei]
MAEALRELVAIVAVDVIAPGTSQYDRRTLDAALRESVRHRRRRVAHVVSLVPSTPRGFRGYRWSTTIVK